MSIDRQNRKRLGVAVAAAIAAGSAGYAGKKMLTPELQPKVEPTSDTRPTRTESYTLTHKEIAADRKAAIASLIANTPQGKQFDHLRDAEFLRAEATMYAPGETEQRVVRGKSMPQLAALGAATPDGGYGFFGFADMDESGTEYHRLYVMQKDASGAMQFVKGYKVSMGEKGFGNKKDSGQTPVGLRHFLDTFKGMHGEVADATGEAHSHFKLTQGNRRFVSTFDGRARMEPAAVVTGRLTIDWSRGVHFHQSNRTGYWQVTGNAKQWVSMLGGPASGACGRMAGADFEDAFRYVQAQLRENGKVVNAGTPIYIHATPPVMERSRGRGQEVGSERSATSSPEGTHEGRPSRPAGRRFTPFDNGSQN